MRRALVLGLALLAVLVAIFGLRTAQVAGAFRELEPHTRGVTGCRLVEGPVGPEDITVHPETGLAFVSARDRRAAAAGEPVPGAIWSYDLAASSPEPVNRTPEAGVGFQPHGISLWRGPEGPARLFAIVHPPEGEGPRHAVELFDVEGASLAHRTSYTHEELVMPNDLVAVGPEHFYLTSTHASPPGLLQTLESYLRYPGGSVVYRGPEGWRTVEDGLRFPNGINASADGRTLYVATVLSRELLVYDRNPRSESLALRRRIPLGSGADNVEVDADGALWIGAHPKLFAVQAHASDPESPSPSQVLRVEPDAADPGDAVSEVLLRSGERFSGSSVAARWRDRLLVGRIFDEGFLDCTLAPALR